LLEERRNRKLSEDHAETNPREGKRSRGTDGEHDWDKNFTRFTGWLPRNDYRLPKSGSDDRDEKFFAKWLENTRAKNARQTPLTTAQWSQLELCSKALKENMRKWPKPLQ
jgi:hypothetical protein